MANSKGELRESSGNPRRLWWEGGAWWFQLHADGPKKCLTVLLRAYCYQISALLDSLQVSERNFRRVVQEGLGISPGHWLRQLRAVDAQLLLREGASMEEVAIRLGFRSEEYFRAEFKYWHGVTPRQYLKIQRRLMEDSSRDS